jgi:hypothetical protein
MKGIVFTELIEFLEDNFGFDATDEIIEKANLENGGAFTQVGQYPFEELVKLVVSICEVSRKPMNEVLEIFGEHLFKRLVAIYGEGANAYKGTIDFLANVDQQVHVEVAKLYPDADLPRFFVKEKTDDFISIVYQSEKKLEDFATGLMKGCAKYFNEEISITKENISNNPYEVKFEVTVK